MNTLRESAPAAGEQARGVSGSKGKKPRAGRMLRSMLSGEFLTREGLINHLPFIAFLTGLFLLHISLMYFFESTQHRLSKARQELNEMRSQYNTTMSELETRKQQSSVARDIEALGLRELRTPPQIIDVEKGFLKTEND